MTSLHTSWGSSLFHPLCPSISLLSGWGYVSVLTDGTNFWLERLCAACMSRWNRLNIVLFRVPTILCSPIGLTVNMDKEFMLNDYSFVIFNIHISWGMRQKWQSDFQTTVIFTYCALLLVLSFMLISTCLGLSSFVAITSSSRFILLVS
jgi:hypothetical protein